MNKNVENASKATVWTLFESRARSMRDAAAIVDGDHSLTYDALAQRVTHVGAMLRARAIGRGDRIAILARNCLEYLVLELAAARCGAIVAALNWRLAKRELRHCMALVEPRLLILQPEFCGAVEGLDCTPKDTLVLGHSYEDSLAYEEALAHEEALADEGASGRAGGAGREGSYPPPVDPEDPLVVLYTSGTTGLPKGAVISQRAMIARAMCFADELNLPIGSDFVAWAPLYHMASTDHALATLMRGGTVFIVDGYQPQLLMDLVERVEIGWFVLMPGMVGDFADACRKRGVRPRSVHVCGAMADLVPAGHIAAVTTMLDAPYLNSFGATETGLPPATGALIAKGVVPQNLAKRQSAWCDLRLVDPQDKDVREGEPGEVALRGPTLFSGYWQADETNAYDFRNGWFHMGDVMRRNEDGTLDYVDRVKYLIKSGGENIYPAEIEQVVEGDSRIQEAIVVRAGDEKWGEVPVLFVVRRDAALKESDLETLCERHLSRYKRPKRIIFIKEDDLPRSTTGKIQRHILEESLRAGNFGPS